MQNAFLANFGKNYYSSGGKLKYPEHFINKIDIDVENILFSDYSDKTQEFYRLIVAYFLGFLNCSGISRELFCTITQCRISLMIETEDNSILLKNINDIIKRIKE